MVDAGMCRDDARGARNTTSGWGQLGMAHDSRTPGWREFGPSAPARYLPGSTITDSMRVS